MLPHNTSGSGYTVALKAFYWIKVRDGLSARLHLQQNGSHGIELYKGRLNKDSSPKAKQGRHNTYELTIGAPKAVALGFEIKAFADEDAYVLWFRPTSPYTGTGDE